MKTSETKTTASQIDHQSSNAPFFQPKRSDGALSALASTGSAVPFFQTKLTVGQPNDKYEREADATADQVIQQLSKGPGNVQRKCASCEQEEGIAPKLQRKAVFESNEDRPIQRSCACPACQPKGLVQRMGGEEEEMMQGKAKRSEGLQLQGMEEEEMMQGKATRAEGLQLQGMEEEEMMQGKATRPEGLQLQGMEEEEMMQGKATRAEGLQLQGMEEEEMMQGKATRAEGLQLQGMEEEEAALQTKRSVPSIQASSDLENRLNATKGGGSPLPAETQESMGASIGADFSGVRVHTDNNSVQMNQELGAQAFTHGSDVYFNAGKYDTQSSSGQHLLAHELTHTVQQGASGPMEEQKKE